MKSNLLRAPIAGLIAAIALAACGGGALPSGGGAPAPTRPAPTVAAPKPTQAAVQLTDVPSNDTAASASPAWFGIRLTDVKSGKTFKLSDFKGQIVLVEGMAVWCPLCTSQQRELARLHEQIGNGAISVSIDVDLNEDAGLLKKHAEANGFTWRFAVAPPELAQAFADTFGNRFLNPPSTPMFLIDKQGGTHVLDFGHKTVEYLVAQIQSYQSSP